MKVEGSCHCGFVTFTAEVDPESAGICHCTDCQTISGSAFRTTVRSLPGKLDIDVPQRGQNACSRGVPLSAVFLM